MEQDASYKYSSDKKIQSMPPENNDHPRKNIPEWKWRCTVIVIWLLTWVNGYDNSNLANIQPRLYQAFGNIELFPWIALSYSLSVFCCLTLASKLSRCVDMRWLYLAAEITFITGSAVAGSATNTQSVVVGRVLMGLAGATVQQCNMSFIAIFATPVESFRIVGVMTACWAVGLVAGGPIGSAFSSNEHATWRWALYLNLPVVGLALGLSILCIPHFSFAPPNTSLWRRLRKIDPVGIVLNIVTVVLFSIALTFSGPIWDWGSGASIAVWVAFGVALIAWIIQQHFCIFTTPDERAIPVRVLFRRDLLPLWIASGCAGATYSITLYYTPLFFAFARGMDVYAQTVRILPFICCLIATVMIVGGILPIFGRYKYMYIAAGAMTLTGGAAMAATLKVGVSDSQILGLLALLGMGLGMHFLHNVSISNAINKDENDRVDGVLIGNVALMGGISLILVMAGSIFQNVGYNFLVDALGDEKYSKQDVREALAGASSVLWQSRDPEVLERGIAAVSKVIAREFYLVVASGALCLISGLLMSGEKLESKKADDSERKSSQTLQEESSP